MKELLTIDEISEYLGIKKSTLYSKVERREIPFYKIGHLIRFRKAEIDAWMENFKAEPEDLGVRARKITRTIQETRNRPALPPEKPLATANQCEIYSFLRETGPQNQGPREGG